MTDTNEVFKTEREFYKKFPSRFYICPECGYMSANKYFCHKCQSQANALFSENRYTYTIQETGKTETIFKPIELKKGEVNG